MTKKSDKESWIYLFIFFTLIVLPDWVEIFVTHIPIKMAIGELLRAYLVLLIPFILFAKWYRLYLFLLLVLAITLNLFDIGFLYLYHARIDQVAFDVAMQTNIQEAIEYTDGYRVYLIIGFIINAIALTIVYKRIKFNNPKSLKILSLISLLIILFMTYRSSKIIYKKVDYQTFSEVLYTNIVTTNSPWILFKFAFKHIEKQKELDTYKKIKKDFLFNAKKLDDKKQIHVLIIGEASRYDHWQINGYHRETSPYLMKEKNILSLANVVTGAGATNWSVPMMISPSDARNFNDTLKKGSLVQAYKEAGYKTYWLSNQDWFPYLNIHIDEAGEQFFLKKENRFAYDEELLPKFKKILQENKDNNILIILHIMGSHWRYDRRNPKKFDIFEPSIDRDSFIRMDNYKEKKSIINSYDNSIFYNDDFIHLVLEQLKKLKVPTTMTFVADHGENLYDNSKKLFGHGRHINPYVYRVPYFFWYSKSYEKEYGNKISNIKNNQKNKITSSTNLFYSMLDIGQVRYKDINTSKSIFSNQFLEEKRVVLEGLSPVDYDQFINNFKVKK
jgi:glucan phosphoethanolaminetransferase (alkaline phosphatase superfamily)